MFWIGNYFTKKTVLFIAIILVAFFLRIYQLDKIFIFGFDEEYQATYANTLVEDFHLVWIGVSASLDNFYLGPYFTYLTALLLFISANNLLFLSYFAAFTGTVTVILIFVIGRKYFNFLTGALAANLYACMPIFVYHDQKYWNPMFDQIIILLLFAVFILANKTSWWFVLFSGLVGLILETHLTPIPLIVVGFFIFFQKKIWKEYRILLVSLIVFLLFYWPLLIFDYNHQWSNLSLPIRTVTEFRSERNSFDPATKLNVFFDSLGRFWFLQPGGASAEEVNFTCNPLTYGQLGPKQSFETIRSYGLPILAILSVIVLVFSVWYAFAKHEKVLKLLLCCILVQLFFYFIFPGSATEYHLLGVFVLFVFLPGIIISQQTKRFKYILLVLVSLPVILGAYTVLKNRTDFAMEPKLKIISETKNIIQNSSFELNATGFCHQYEGWRYLFKANGVLPIRSYSDKNLGWLYPKELSDERADYEVSVSETRVPHIKMRQSNYIFNGGGYTVYIKKNEKDSLSQ